MKSGRRRVYRSEGVAVIMTVITFCVILLLFAMSGVLCFKSLPILKTHSLSELLTASSWRPSKNEFGFFPFIAGTLCVTAIAIVIALPLSFLTAVFLTEYSSGRIRRYVYPALDILSSLPSVIFGVWGTLVIVPWISKRVAPLFVGFSSGYTLLAAGIVLGIMILPLLVSLFTELFSSVPIGLKEVSASLGATRWQTTKKVVIKRSLPGIFATVVLALSRALGETIAVLMVCGNLPQVPHSFFDACYPLPALIANNYGEMLSVPLYEAALMFAALLLFFVVLIFNVLSRIIYRAH